MNKLCTITAALAAWFAATSPALAWTLPDLGYTYFVGTTEELADIRAALRQAECERVGPETEMCTYQGGSVQCSMQPNPYCGTNTYPGGGQAQTIPAGFGTGPLDCMQSYEDYELWPTTETIGTTYLGNSYVVDGVEIYVPASVELISQNELPQGCIAYLENLHCLPGSGWEDLLCPDP